MKLRVIHGFFMFEETRVGQVSDYIGLTGFELVPRGTYYTFKTLLDAPLYSLNSKPFLGFNALKTFEGHGIYLDENSDVWFGFPV